MRYAPHTEKPVPPETGPAAAAGREEERLSPAGGLPAGGVRGQKLAAMKLMAMTMGMT